jgi:hypothetical protein
MLGRKLGYRPSVLLENAVRLDDERHAGLPLGGIEGPSNIISHFSRQRAGIATRAIAWPSLSLSIPAGWQGCSD